MNHLYTKAALLVAWRVFQIAIVVPARMVATALAGMVLTGQSPARDTVIALHHWATTSVVPAAVGTVLVTECVAKDNGDPLPPVICDSTRPKAVPVEQFAASTASELKAVYFALVFISFLGVFLFAPEVRLFSRQSATES